MGRFCKEQSTSSNRNVIGKTDAGGKTFVRLKCPDISVSMVELTLKAMLDEGSIRKIGNGRTTAYARNDR